ncbi:hypothetical protein [Bacillus sp. SM2101]|uniref:hypothetical protein n=1 Tax=Bacillus sp. SM2101 TaxID=2805366 RepID=UPI001BDE2E24|nr:hypothetical protein [Bacillus sp. SM2101]
MNVTYRTNFILRMGLPLLLYFFIFTNHSNSKLTLILAVFSTIQVITFGVDIHKKGKWNKINFQHDQRTRNNAFFAGYIIYWMTILFLLIGAFLIKNSFISISYLNLISYSIILGFIFRWIIRDYLNYSGAIEE